MKNRLYMLWLLVVTLVVSSLPVHFSISAETLERFPTMIEVDMTTGEENKMQLSGRTRDILSEIAPRPATEEFDPDKLTLSTEELLDFEEKIKAEYDEIVFEGNIPPQNESAYPNNINFPDERTLIEDTTAYPNSAIAYVFIVFDDGYGDCSGFLYGPSTVITNSHCLWDPDYGYAQFITVYPGRNGQEIPFGGSSAKQILVNSDYVNTQQPKYDYGIIKIHDPLGSYTGTFGFRYRQNWEDTYTRVTGYPSDPIYDADKPDHTQWTMRGPIDFESDGMLNYRMDTTRGQSGGPVYIDPAYAVGIHGYGFRTEPGYNRAVKITQEMIAMFAYYYE